MNDILATLTADGSFQTLLAVLKTAGLTGTLAEPGPLTLFAPDDAAFGRVNLDVITGDRQELAGLLTYHMVPGRLTAADLARSEHLLTANGKSLTVQLTEGRPVIDNAGLVTSDIECSNGIVHVIDNVFLPRMSGWYCGGCC